jgi:hypothetical protein
MQRIELRSGREDPRVGVAVALRGLLDDDRRDVEQRRQARHPRDAGDRVGRASNVVGARPVRGSKEPGLRVDDDEDAVLAPDERH